MDAIATTPSIAAKDDSAVEATQRTDALNVESLPAEPIIPSGARTTPVQMLLIVLGPIAFLYFARPVVLPVFLACVAAMTLKPLIRWLSYCHIRPALSAAIVLCLLMSGLATGFFQLGRPALTWMNDAPQHLTELRQRFQKLFPGVAWFSQAAAAVNNLGATEEEKKPNKSGRPRWR